MRATMVLVGLRRRACSCSASSIAVAERHNGFFEMAFCEGFMENANQQELIRLWCQLRKARGPAAEEIRIRMTRAAYSFNC